MNAITLEEAKKLKLMKRVDCKYVLSYDQYCSFIRCLPDDWLVAESNGKTLLEYYTVYFDTPEMTMLKDHLDKKSHRQKIRIREYSTGEKFLEIKDKNNHVTTKTRVPVNSYELDGETQWISENLMYDTRSLSKKLSTKFYRMTLVNPQMSSRITIDFDIVVYNYSTKKFWNHPWPIVEVKKESEASTKAEDILFSLGAFPQGFSKFARGCAETSSF